MPESTQPRIFLSYSRADGKAFARELRDRLEMQDLPLWHDLVDMESGNWWHQIEKTIGSNALEHVALIVTPAALASGNVAKEWRLARARGVQVNLVQGTPDLDHSSMPKWMQAQHVFNTSEPEQWDKLVEVLNGPGMQAPVPFLPDETHDKFIPRPNEYDALKAALLDDKRDAVAITAALKGAGGFGKTALAHALARDANIREAFFDGVTFIQLGEEMSEAKLLTILAEQIKKLTGEPQAPKTLGEAGDTLAEALGEKHILLVIDDVWREFDLKPFLKGGPNSARLITTRMDEVLPANAVKVPVDAMQGDEAVALLARGLPQDEVDQQRETLRALAARLGEWPLLLELANGLLRRRVTAFHETLASALAHANRRLNDKKLTTFDARNPVERNDAVAKSIAVSLELLAEDERTRFFELAIFPEDAEVPIDTIARLWRRTGRLDEIDSEDLLTHLASLSLLYSLDLQTRAARLHDVIRHYLRDEAGEEKLRALNNSFIAAQPDAGAEILEAGEKTYLYTWFLHHLRDAGREDAIEPILLDPEWMQGKLDATSALALAGDYKQFGKSHAADFVGRCIDLTANILERDKRQLFPQLIGRMTPDMADGLGEMLVKVRSLIKTPAFISRWPSLTRAAGPEIRRFEGHFLAVQSIAISPDGLTVVSGSRDGTLRFWDIETGEEKACIAAGEPENLDGIKVAYSPDGRSVITGFRDGRLRLWNVETYRENIHFRNYAGAIQAITFSPTGRTAASGSQKGIIRLWDTESGRDIACIEALKNYWESIGSVAFSPDGKMLISGSDENTIIVWDVETGQVRVRLLGHTGAIKGLAFCPDGRQIISGSADETLRLWDISGSQVRVFEGHTGPVNTVAFSLDGRLLASGSEDKSVRLWETETGKELARFDGHSDWVHSVTFNHDARLLVSSSEDSTIRIWKIQSAYEASVPKSQTAYPQIRHTGTINSLAFSPDGQVLVSGSDNSTFRLWHVGSELPFINWTVQEPSRSRGVTPDITAVAFSPDGQKVVTSSSSASSISLRDTRTGERITHIDGIFGASTLAFSSDGTVVIYSDNEMMFGIWNLDSNYRHLIEKEQSGYLLGKPKRFSGLAFSANRETVAVGCSDGAFRLLDLQSISVIWINREKARFGRVKDIVEAVAFSPDGRTLVSGSSSGNISLWDVETGQKLTQLREHGSWVNTIAFSPDGRFIVSGSNDHTVSLWDAEHKEEITHLYGDGPFSTLAFAPNGRTFAAGDAIGSVHVFDIIT